MDFFAPSCLTSGLTSPFTFKWNAMSVVCNVLVFVQLVCWFFLARVNYSAWIVEKKAACFCDRRAVLLVQPEAEPVWRQLLLWWGLHWVWSTFIQRLRRPHSVSCPLLQSSLIQRLHRPHSVSCPLLQSSLIQRLHRPHSVSCPLVQSSLIQRLHRPHSVSCLLVQS